MQLYERNYKAVPYVTSLMCPCIRETQEDWKAQKGTEVTYLGMDENIHMYECPSCKGIFRVAKKYPVLSYKEEKATASPCKCGGACICKSSK